FLIKTLNQTAEQLFGASTPELRGRPFLELLAVADRAPFEAAFIKQDPMADYP
ncbi:MAG: hypothetical protein GWN58_40595, partial [Anaerolineae bacterium]|nr:hypothetical protein [Anaerolineae bacterium]